MQLIDVLAASDDTRGVIGIEARASLKRLPSNIYWHGLRVLGIRLFPGSPDQYHRSVASPYAGAILFNDDLVPYWLFPLRVGASIERHVPALPLSRDAERLEALKRSLTLYRMVFGQARQEDLVAFLLQHVPREKLDHVLQALIIDLRPPKRSDDPPKGVTAATDA